MNDYDNDYDVVEYMKIGILRYAKYRKVVLVYEDEDITMNAKSMLSFIKDFFIFFVNNDFNSIYEKSIQLISSEKEQIDIEKFFENVDIKYTKKHGKSFSRIVLLDTFIATYNYYTEREIFEEDNSIQNANGFLFDMLLGLNREKEIVVKSINKDTFKQEVFQIFKISEERIKEMRSKKSSLFEIFSAFLYRDLLSLFYYSHIYIEKFMSTNDKELLIEKKKTFNFVAEKFKLYSNISSNIENNQIYFYDSFIFDSSKSFLAFFLMECITNKVIIKQCENCKQYFAAKSSRNIYCSNVQSNGKICKVIGPRLKAEKDPIKRTKRTAYKSKHAQMSRNKLNKTNISENFLIWSELNKQKFIATENKEMKLEEFSEWQKKTGWINGEFE